MTEPKVKNGAEQPKPGAAELAALEAAGEQHRATIVELRGEVATLRAMFEALTMTTAAMLAEMKMEIAFLMRSTGPNAYSQWIALMAQRGAASASASAQPNQVRNTGDRE
jgi:hypothetical protein